MGGRDADELLTGMSIHRSEPDADKLVCIARLALVNSIVDSIELNAMFPIAG